MEVDEVIEKVIDLNFGDEDLDEACLLRIEKLAMDAGKDGKTALRLIPILRELLNI